MKESTESKRYKFHKGGSDVKKGSVVIKTSSQNPKAGNLVSGSKRLAFDPDIVEVVHEKQYGGQAQFGAVDQSSK